MSVILTLLRDFVVALAFSWLGVTLQLPEERSIHSREAPRPAAACPSGAGSCQTAGPAYRTECDG